ncbi:putative phosphatidate phosphatase [Teleopsis dalmanni]|uniref:putative phosphatidate phosphatase n=2 Tax=Teleopsis dalmanni TaxID=139649 RepID=UPI0018CEE8F6|nr:putative phosphatidate phosphatase [Teleopsis dalmanni]
MQPTTEAADSQTALRAERKQAQRILYDLLIVILAVIPIIICEFGIEPYRRGFFCDDESIRYPFHGNTVTEVMLGLLAGGLSLVMVIIVEFVRFYRRVELSERRNFFGWRMPVWLYECSKQISTFTFGMLLVLDATELGKYTIGRLRPHFMAVCQPILTDGTTCNDLSNRHRYIENYVCAGNGYRIEDVRQSRLSFPSGHSSIAFYVTVYLAIYLHYRLTWRGSKLLRHFLQFILLMLGWFTALSRVMDNWHHWSDVLVGILLGIVGAVIMTRCVAKLHKDGRMCNLKLSLPRAPTTTTLQEVISTPPPYTLNTMNGFSNQQYCTKM